jgi:Xaa-Pro dipeptidase
MSEIFIKNEIIERNRRFQKRLAANGVDGALMVEKTDLYYFSGTKQEGHLYVPAEDAPVLTVRRDFDRAVFESPLERILPMKSLSELPGLVSEANNGPPRRMGLEMDVLPATRYFIYQKLFPKTELVDISPFIREIEWSSLHMKSIVSGPPLK